MDEGRERAVNQLVKNGGAFSSSTPTVPLNSKGGGPIRISQNETSVEIQTHDTP